MISHFLPCILDNDWLRYVLSLSKPSLQTTMCLNHNHIVFSGKWYGRIFELVGVTGFVGYMAWKEGTYCLVSSTWPSQQVLQSVDYVYVCICKSGHTKHEGCIQGLLRGGGAVGVVRKFPLEILWNIKAWNLK